MLYIPTRLTRTNGRPVVINAAMITGVFNHDLGKVSCICIRTVEGNEWLVRESIEQIELAIEAARSGRSSPVAPAPLVVETKAKAKK